LNHVVARPGRNAGETSGKCKEMDFDAAEGCRRWTR